MQHHREFRKFIQKKFWVIKIKYMKMKKIVLGLFLIVSIKSFSQETQNGQQFRLTPEQKQKSIEIHKKFDADLLKLKTKQEKQLAKAKSERRVEKLKKIHKKQIDRLHVAHEKEVEQIYTPEQLERIRNMKKKRLEKKKKST